MSGAEHVSPWPAAPDAAPAPRPRRGLFRKYVLALIGLVAVALIVNAGVEFWFSYRQSEAALLSLQQEKANAAAQRIDAFVTEIEHQIGWTTLPLWDAAPIEQRRFDFIRLLREVPAITSLSELDSAGKEQLKMSRLTMDVVGSGADFSHAPEFTEARAHGVWFGPVYFREQSEPYMILAKAHSGQDSGVTVAEINLKLIEDTVAGMKMGTGGYAYVVDQHGKLIADPDISRVLRDTDLSHLPQVAGALAAMAGQRSSAPRVTQAENGGGTVLSAHAEIESLGWIVFVEVPLQQAFAPLYHSAMRDGLWLIVALFGAALAGLVLARRMTGPIRAMQAGAARIGAGVLGSRIDIHSGDELESLADQFNDMAGRLEASYADLENKVEERTAELTESLEYQTATADVLKVISRSTFDLQPVLDTVCETAARLCSADGAGLTLREDVGYRYVSVYSVEPEFYSYLRQQVLPVDRGSLAGRTVLEGTVVQIPDVAADPEYALSRTTELSKLRTVLGTPLLRDGEVIGTLGLTRTRVEPFTERQIDLVRTFADQAVIAIENARLINETREALEQQTATAEVLGVINASPGNLAPVFDAMLEKALALCGASYGTLLTFDGDLFHRAAQHGFPPAYMAAVDSGPKGLRPGPETGLGRIAGGERIVHLLDIADTDAYRAGDPVRVATVDILGARTCIWVALVKDDALLGALLAYRKEVRPFSDKQIALLQNFAAQAVIAMENARLLTETREGLERQTATSEILRAIAAAPGDAEGTLRKIAETTARLFAACGVAFRIADGDEFNLAIGVGRGAEQVSATLYGSGTARLTVRSRALSSTVVREDRQIHLADLDNLPSELSDWPGPPILRAAGIRTVVGTPLRRQDRAIGALVVYRDELRPFGADELDLLQSFADQAAIAMENARLITETREALDQQTATAEVLGVINASPGDLAPVFDAMLEKATRLCEGDKGVAWTYDGERFHPAAMYGVPAKFAEFLRKGGSPGPATPIGRIARGERLVEIPDLIADPSYVAGEPVPRAAVEIGGIRSVIFVALVKEDTLLGTFAISRSDPRPFTGKQTALLQNFAAQAVIAIENARLINETREALDQQTATAEVLGVINASPGNLAPVFDAMLEKAMRLCEAETAHLLRFDGSDFSRAASRGVPPGFDEIMPIGQKLPHIITRDSVPFRMLAVRKTIHVLDLREDESTRAGAPAETRAAAEGIRTVIFVPLLREGGVVGCFVMHRMVVRPFTDKQIALIENFAAQAVIAMENARLLIETREALDQQTATAEVLGVINASPGDLAPVFDAILDKAHSLCAANIGWLLTFDGEFVHSQAMRGLGNLDPALASKPFLPGPAMRRLIEGESFVQLPEIADFTDPSVTPLIWRASVELLKTGTYLVVPLRKDGAVRGFINAFRSPARLFSEKEIALLQNFAAQAVIAIENTRLLTETREALEHQTATAEVLQVINSSPGNLQPVFDAILEKAHSLCGAVYGNLTLWDGEESRVAAVRGGSAFTVGQRARPGPNSPLRKLIAGDGFLQIPDVREIDDPISKSAAAVGTRTALFIPLRKDGALLGYLVAPRQEVRPFTDKQIALLQNFAAQAVIAMENARLLGEIRQRQAELRVTFDNMGDGVVMFDRDLRLAAWNRNFQQIMDLPDEFLAEPKNFADYIRYLAERGEFGAIDPEAEIARLSARFADQYDFERTRPDGTVIEVRHNPMPDGGFVLIYSDITERKRSEAEIRAARAAAERALGDLKTAQASLIQAEKMASLGQLTAGIAHEIKNPLNFVNNFAGLSNELLGELKEIAAPALATLDENARADLDETMAMLGGNLEKIAEHGKRADNIVKSMLEHSRGASGERRPVDLNALVEESLNLAYHGARAQDQSFNITLERDFAAGIAPLEVVPQDVTRVLLNLIGNGFHAAHKRLKDTGDPGFRPVLKLATRDLGDAVEVRVRDNGIGIPPENRNKLFQPFFTTKPTGEGTGLGLSISYDIVTQQHGGTITVDSAVGAYTEFTVLLPRAEGDKTTGRSA